MNRHPEGASNGKGGRFAPDTSGRTPPTAADGSAPASSLASKRPWYASDDPYADASGYVAYQEARYSLPLADDLRAEVEKALAESPWAGSGIDVSAAEFTARESGVIAAALNHRLMTWPRETSGGPEAAGVRRLFSRFAERAAGE